jgi:thiamine biosynthesis lipoprotein
VGAEVGKIVESEARRIEAKFSRYRPSDVTRINNTAGTETEVDDETADLLDYAVQCHGMSAGRFDKPEDVREVMQYVGWHKATWSRPTLWLAPGMEIDFGGIGDLRVSGPRADGGPWHVAIEDVDRAGSVTVHAGSRCEAGLLAKLALLRGKDAEAFLRAEQVRSWCMR